MNDLETITIKPAPDRRVRHEDGRLLAAVGDTVLRTPYWSRRLADDDVVETKAAAALPPVEETAGAVATTPSANDAGAENKAGAGRAGAKGDKA